MKRTILGVLVLATLSLGLPTPTRAAGDTMVLFTALLNGAQADPANDSPSQGVALVEFFKKSLTVCYRLSYSPPLPTGEIVAHFHGPAAPGTPAGVLVQISPSPSPLGSPKHGCVTFTKDQAKLLTKGLVYINIHSVAFPLGEIRGQVLPAKVSYSNQNPPASPSGAFLDVR